VTESGERGIGYEVTVLAGEIIENSGSGMKIALVRYRYSSHGGAERYLDTLATGLQAAGAQIRLLSSSWEGGDTPNIPWERISVPRRPAPLRIYLFARAVQSWARTHPDWLLFSLERIPGAEVYRAGDGCHAEWLLRKRVLLPFSWGIDSLRPLNRAYLHLERSMFRSKALRAVIANSERGKEEIIRHFGISGDRISVVYNGLDLSRFPMERKEEARGRFRNRFGIGDDETAFLFVGSGFARKGVGALVRAARRLAEKERPFRVILAGKGNPGPYLRVAGTARGNLLFCGPVKSVEDYFLGADVFVFPTVYDPFSNACLEAMAAGLPVITSRGNGASEFLRDGHSGFVLEDPMDDALLSERMEFLFDVKVQERMGGEARRASEKATLERNVGETLAVLQRAWREKEEG
jgi:UDP-glucose:(heptosyl)LPS alpha-1,3-glucosyltransferase